MNPFPLSRRDTLAWIARAGIAVTILPVALSSCGSATKAVKLGPGYGRDPNLLEPKVPWPLTMTDAQKASVSKLADLLLPADSRSPSASSLGISAFVDEWVSAPYPDQQKDREIIFFGLEWLDKQSSGRFITRNELQSKALCDRICDADRAAPADKEAAIFFERFRHVCMAAFYTTEAGMDDIGYVRPEGGDRFEGPPPEVLDRMEKNVATLSGRRE